MTFMVLDTVYELEFIPIFVFRLLNNTKFLIGIYAGTHLHWKHNY